MPFQNRRRLEARRRARRLPPPVPNPPATGLLARYAADMVSGTIDGRVVAQPPDGPLGLWQSVGGTFSPLRAIDAGHMPELSDIDGMPIVMFDPGEVMVSPFVPPTGSSPRTIIFIGLGQGEGRIIGSGAATALHAFDLVVTEGKYGWDFGGDPQPSGADADDEPHAISMVMNGTEFALGFDESGTEPEEVDLDTDPSWLTLGSSDVGMAVLEVLVYDHDLFEDEDEDAALRDYLAEKYGFGDEDVPLTGLLARFRASEVNGSEGALPDDSAAISDWLQIDDETPPLTQVGGAPMFLRRNGLPRVRFQPTKTMSALLDGMPDADGHRTIVLMGVNWHPDADQLFVSQGDAGVERGLFALGTAPTTGRAAGALDADTFLSGLSTLDINGHTLVFAFDGTTVTFQIDANDPITLATDLDTASAEVFVGSSLGNFDAYELLFYNVALSPGGLDRVLAYFGTRYIIDAPDAVIPSATLLMEWRANSINGLDSAGVVTALGASGQRQFLRPHKVSTAGSFVQNTAMIRPQFFNSNVSFIRFGSGQTMTSPVVLPTGTAARTIVFIGRDLNAVSQQIFHYGDMTTDNAGFGLVTDGAGVLRWSGGGTVGGEIGKVDDEDLHVIIVTVAAGGIGVSVRVDYNGNIPFGGLSLNTSAVADPPTLGAVAATPEFVLVHLLAYSTALDGADQNSIVDYSREVYGAPAAP